MNGTKSRMNRKWVVVSSDRYDASQSQQVVVDALTVGEAFVKGVTAIYETEEDADCIAAEYLKALVGAENGDGGVDFEEESWFVSELNM